MRHLSPFHDIVAVEAWDAWFRWRDGSQLRDLAINDTWQRVARALSPAEPADRHATFEQQLLDACLGWRLLLDERLLLTAGTHAPAWPAEGLTASLNAAVFVQAPFTVQAAFRHDAFEDTAELAVRALDDAALVAPEGAGRAGAHLRIGIIGLADALAQLRLPYDSAPGRDAARGIARSLARGCLRGSMRLAVERGAPFALPDVPALSYKLRELAPELEADAERNGVRHRRLTDITSQRRLSLLANNVTDAIDPLLAQGYAHTISGADATRSAYSPGYAMALAQRLNARQALRALAGELAAMTLEAQVELRAAMQMWIDSPILYPLVTPATAEIVKAAATPGVA